MGQVNWVKNLILAIALCVLGTFAYWLEYKHKPEQESIDENFRKPFVLKETQIDSIRMVSGNKTFEWNCQDMASHLCKPGDNSKWKLAQPLQVRADDSNANSLVSALSNLLASDVIELKDETPEKRANLLKDYGLTVEARKTARRIEIKTTDGTTTAYFGGSHPISEGIFALTERAGKVDESKVYLIPSYFKANFEHDLTYWRDKKILGFAIRDIESFSLESKQNGTLWAQRKGNEWIVKNKTGEFAGDIENVDAILTASAFLLAKDFTSDNKTNAKAKAALKGTHEVLKITFNKAKESFTLTLFEKNKALYAVASNLDPLYELQPSSKPQFMKTLKDLRLSKLITSMDRLNAKRLEFSGKPVGDKSLTLISQDGKWTMPADKTELDLEKIQSTLDRLSGNRIREFLPTIPAGEQDGLKFTLGDADAPSKRRLVFWKKDGKLFARDLESSRKEAFLVDGAVADGLPWNRSYFNKAAPNPK